MARRLSVVAGVLWLVLATASVVEGHLYGIKKNSVDETPATDRQVRYCNKSIYVDAVSFGRATWNNQSTWNTTMPAKPYNPRLVSVCGSQKTVVIYTTKHATNGRYGDPDYIGWWRYDPAYKPWLSSTNDGETLFDEIWLNKSYLGTAGADGTKMTLKEEKQTATHEFGHALALDHSNPGQLMSGMPSVNSPGVIVPQSHDAKDYHCRWDQSDNTIDPSC